MMLPSPPSETCTTTATFDLPASKSSTTESGALIPLTEGSPDGGLYSGPGVITDVDGNFFFDPSLANIGTNEISYGVLEAVFLGEFLGDAAGDRAGTSVAINDNGDRIILGLPAV